MNFRSIHDIFPAFYTDIPDTADIRSVVDMYMDRAMEALDACELYSWIERTECPYMREAYATILHSRILERNSDTDDEWRINLCLYQETIEPNICKIIRLAHTDQIALEKLGRKVSVCDAPRQQLVLPDFARQMQYLTQEVEFLKQHILKSHDNTESWQWPYYTDKATDEDKQVFETHLHSICACTRRSRTQEIKDYLALKAKTGLITRPKYMVDEHAVVCRFGYDRSYTSYNA